MKLLHYIRGSRKGKEAHRIEREAMRDPFLADAIEGFDSVPGDHARHIQELQAQISASSRKKHHYLRNWSVAAGLLLIFSVGGYFTLRDPKPSGTWYSKAITPIDDQEIHPSIYNQTAEKQQTKEKAPTTVKQKPTVSPADEQHAESAKISVQAEQTATDQKTEQTNRLLSPDKPVIIQWPESIQTTAPNTLNVNYMGYRPAKISVDTPQSVEISMHPDYQNLSEVAVTKIKKNSFEELKIANTDAALQGRIAGLDVTSKQADIPESKTIQDVTPEPVIGKKQYQKYLEENLIRPTDEECKDKKGNVILSFYVDITGKPFLISVEKNLCPSADAEAIRLIQNGPLWTNGTKKAQVEIKF